MNINARFETPVPNSEADVESIYALLRAKGAPERCYAISTDCDVDAREFDLMAGLGLAEGGTTILSCIPGRLAYYESHEGDRLILERSAR